MMTHEQLAKLERLAKAANGYFGFSVKALMEDAEMQRAPAEFINACSPDTILALLAELEQARGERDAHLPDLKLTASLMDERDRLAAENADLRNMLGHEQEQRAKDRPAFDRLAITLVTEQAENARLRAEIGNAVTELHSYYGHPGPMVAKRLRAALAPTADGAA